MPASEKARLRGLLAAMLKRIPTNIAGASINQVKAFKHFHAKASKTVEANRAPLHEWTSLYAQALEIYK